MGRFERRGVPDAAKLRTCMHNGNQLMVFGACIVPYLFYFGPAYLSGVCVVNQMSFGWREPSRKIVSCIFFMIRPDAAANAAVDRMLPQWRKEFGLRGKPIEAGRRHVSLAAVGRRDQLLDGSVDLMRTLSARVVAAPFEVRFNRIASFGGDSVVLFDDQGNPGVDSFCRIFSRAMAGTPLAHKRQFTAHMTVLYDHSLHLHAHPIEPISWIAKRFVLIESMQGAGRHIELGRWYLSADGLEAH